MTESNAVVRSRPRKFCEPTRTFLRLVTAYVAEAASMACVERVFRLLSCLTQLTILRRIQIGRNQQRLAGAGTSWASSEGHSTIIRVPRTVRAELDRAFCPHGISGDWVR